MDNSCSPVWPLGETAEICVHPGAFRHTYDDVWGAIERHVPPPQERGAGFFKAPRTISFLLLTCDKRLAGQSYAFGKTKKVEVRAVYTDDPVVRAAFDAASSAAGVKYALALVNVYHLTDPDKNPSRQTLGWHMDDEPEIEVNPESPNASGNNEVDEAGLDDGGSQAQTDLETTSGGINIDTGSDTLASLKIVDKDGTQVDVTNGGTVQGVYGTLTVTESNGDYSYSYTLADNTEDHMTQGTATDDVKDDFALVIEDSDEDCHRECSTALPGVNLAGGVPRSSRRTRGSGTRWTA